ncbi:MAG: toprim domain-containing protein [Minisyncoccia bacterium]
MQNDSIERLVKLFVRFPGIGERQAKRFAYFILAQQTSYVQSLAVALTTARASAHTCAKCLRIFEANTAEIPGLCTICSDERRDQSTIVVVEKGQDIEAFARTDYKGLFFVLGGLIPIIQKNIVEGTHIAYLQTRIETEKEVLKELILAFPLTPNGDHTDQAVREILAPTLPSGISITSLGRGLSTGAELEYADPASLSASLKKRE